jgi:ketosteroid isomerase-like protein
MSEENVGMARRAYEAFNRGDVEGMVADIASNFEYVTTGTVRGQAFTGSEEAREATGPLE